MWATVPAGAPFAATVAAELVKRHSTPLALAAVTIWVPTARLATSLQQALAEVAGDTLLPRIQPLHLTEEAAAEDSLQQEISAISVVDPVAKLFFFMRQIRTKSPDLPSAQALAAARSLVQLVDTLTHYDLTPDQLRHAAPSELANHWQENLVFMDIALMAYHAWIKETNRKDHTVAQKNWFLVMSEQVQQQ